MQPAQYLPPWLYQTDTQQAALRWEGVRHEWTHPAVGVHLLVFITHITHPGCLRECYIHTFVARRVLLDELKARSADLIRVDEDQGYVSARVSYGGDSEDYDTLQFLLKPDGVVLFKSEAAVNRPSPPFCFTPGCISGPANRQRLEALRDDLGWTALETDEDKQWVPILLH